MNVVLEIGIHLASSMIATNGLFQHPLPITQLNPLRGSVRSHLFFTTDTVTPVFRAGRSVCVESKHLAGLLGLLVIDSIYEVIGPVKQKIGTLLLLGPGSLSRAPVGHSSRSLTGSPDLSQWSAGTKRNKVQ